MKTYLRILGYARPFADFVPLYFLYTVLGIIFGLCNFTLVIPLLNVLFGTTEQHTATATAPPDFALSIDYIKTTFDYYFTQVTLSRGKLGALSFVCMVLIVSVFLSNLFRYLGLRLIARVRARVIRNMRHALYERITQLQLGYFSGERKGDLMSRLTNDVQEVEGSVVNTLTGVIRDPLFIVAYFVLLLYMSVKLTLFTLLILPVSGLLISGISKRLKRQAHQSQESLGTMLTVIDETLGAFGLSRLSMLSPTFWVSFGRRTTSTHARCGPWPTLVICRRPFPNFWALASWLACYSTAALWCCRASRS